MKKDPKKVCRFSAQEAKKISRTRRLMTVAAPEVDGGAADGPEEKPRPGPASCWGWY